MDNPVDGVDNVGAVFAFLAAHPVVAAVLQGPVFFIIGGVFAVPLLILIQRSKAAAAASDWLWLVLNRPLQRVDMVMLVLLANGCPDLAHRETRERLRDLQRDVDHIAMDLRELRAQNKCMEAP